MAQRRYGSNQAMIKDLCVGQSCNVSLKRYGHGLREAAKTLGIEIDIKRTSNGQHYRVTRTA